MPAWSGVVVFALGNVVQTRVGHSFEPRGRDDTHINMAEFRRTMNPVPLVLIFYYHWVEIFFAFGYAKDAHAEMAAARDKTLKALHL